MQKEYLPRVLVGCPTSEHKNYALKEYAIGIKSLSYGNFDVLIADNSENDGYINKIKELKLPVVKGPYSEFAKQRIVDSRNILRERVLNENYDYFLSLEQDVIPPKDVIQRLLSHGKEIVSGVYFTYPVSNKGSALTPLLWKKDGKDAIKFLSEKEISANRLIEVAACGLGCVLIHKDVLKKIKFRHDKKFEGFDDIWFGYDTFNAGFKIFADTSIKCKHLIRGWSWDGLKE